MGSALIVRGERYAWYVVGVLLVAYTCSFIDRMILSLLLQPIRAEFAVSDTEVSLLIGFAFAILYTLLGLPLGWLADRGNRRAIIVVGVLVWSVATAASGLAPSFGALFAARVLVGVGEAALSPAAYSLMADYFSRERLGRAIAVYSIGVPLGSGLALMAGGAVVGWANSLGTVTLPLIGAGAPWRLVFLLVGLPGLVVALLMLTVREPPRRDAGTAAASQPITAGLAFVRDQRALFLPLIGGLSLLVLVMYGFMAWIPTYFARSHGVAPATAGLWFGIVLSIGGAAGLLAGGALADRFYGKGRADAHILVLLIAVLGSAPFFIVAPLMPSPEFAIAAIAVAMTIATMHGGVAGAVLQIVTPNRLRGQITALYLFITNLVGFGLGATSIALVTDEAFRADAALGTAMALVAAVVMPLSALSLFAARRPYRQAMRQAFLTVD